MTDFDTVDIFTDESLVEDPYEYFEHLRGQCPIAPLPQRDAVVGVTGFDEAMAIYRDPETFSSINSGAGPFLPLPSAPEGDDISDLIEVHRESVRKMLGALDLIMLDPPQHTQERAVLMRLITPRRLSQNEEFMWRHADTYLDEMVPAGRCEFITEYSRPFTYFVIADLLGVPEEVHDVFRHRLDLNTTMPGDVRPSEGESGEASMEQAGGFEFLGEWFASFLEDRRRAAERRRPDRHPALAKYPDGSTPPMDKITRAAVFLFLAGTETSARLLATCLKVLAENAELQDQLRDDRQPGHELRRGGTPLREPGQDGLPHGPAYDEPRWRRAACRNLRLDLPRCGEPGPAPLRSPGRSASIDRTLKRTWPSDVGSTPAPAVRSPGPRRGSPSTASSTAYATSGCRRSTTGRRTRRRFEYAPTFVLRGLKRLHLEFTAVDQ